MKTNLHKIAIFILTICFLTLSFSNSYAQDCQVESTVALPITFSGFTPTIPVVINGQTVQFSIDTGSETSVVTPETASDFGLPQDPKHLTHLIGNAGPTLIHNVFLDVDIGGLHFTKLSVPVSEMPVFPASNKNYGANFKYGGIVGTDILSNFDLDFDFPNLTVNFYRLQNCTSFSPPWQRSYAQIPVRIGQAKQIIMPVELDGYPLTAIFDTGSDGQILSMTSIDRAGLTASALAQDPHAPNAGIGSQTFQQIPVHRFVSLKIGDDTLNNVMIPVGSVNSREGADMRIGEDYMHTRHFWLSYAMSTIFVQ